MKIKDVLVMAAIGLLGAACSDDDNKGSQWGDGVGGTKTNLDVSAYDKWTYVNLKTGETEIHPDTSEWIYTDGSVSEPKAKETIGIEWHIAIHRYEIKTNGGMVFDTEKTNMNEITELPEGDYKADENITNEDEEYAIITDMSKMMQGNVGYAKTATVNKVLCSWVKKTETGSMPPTIYEPTMHVIVLKCKDGSWAKLQFTVAGNSETNKSGFVTFNYDLSRLNKNETGSLFLTFFAGSGSAHCLCGGSGRKG